MKKIWRPSYTNPFDWDQEYELLRFAYWRIHNRIRRPYFLPGENDWYAPDNDLMQAAQQDLAWRKTKPQNGLWFDEDFDGCWMCGSHTSTVTDHCHVTGLARGELCTSCNVQEGKSDAPRFEAWRTTAPWLEQGRRWIYKRECRDCSDETLKNVSTFILIDFHNFWETEFKWFLTTVKGLETRGMRMYA
jgi:hypothetical protein